MSNQVVRMGRNGYYTLMFKNYGESEEDLKSFYSKYGEIAKVVIVNVNLVFLSFYKEADAQKCLEENACMKVPDEKKAKQGTNYSRKSEVDNYDWRNPPTNGLINSPPNKLISHYEMRSKVVRSSTFSTVSSKAVERMVTLPWEQQKKGFEDERETRNFTDSHNAMNTWDSTPSQRSWTIQTACTVTHSNDMQNMKENRSYSDDWLNSKNSGDFSHSDDVQNFEHKGDFSHSGLSKNFNYSKSADVHSKHSADSDAVSVTENKVCVPSCDSEVINILQAVPSSDTPEAGMEVTEFISNVGLDRSSPPPLVKRCVVPPAHETVQILFANFPEDLTKEDIFELMYQLKPLSLGDIKWTPALPKIPYIIVGLSEQAASVLESWNHLLYSGRRLIVAPVKKLIEEGSML